jgi:prophage maintenance system killer protein
MAPPDWDEDSPELHKNLDKVLLRVRDDGRRRLFPDSAMAKLWHTMTMDGLDPDGDPSFVGSFRGEPGLERLGVRIGGIEGVKPWAVDAELGRFFAKLKESLQFLDGQYPPGGAAGQDGEDAAIDLAAWAHAEWVRIHPFANGNGRSARTLANFVLVRYGIPPVIDLRPRPDDGYDAASAKAMQGDWKPTAAVFRQIIATRTAPPGRRR